MKNIVFCILLCCAVNGSVGQQISGTVTDQGGLPLPGANVYVVHTFSGTSSNEQGNFKLIHVSDTAFYLRVAFVGYKELDILIEPQRDTVIHIVLEANFNHLNTVVISASTYETGVSAKAVVMNSIEMATTAGSLGDINAALQTLPGTSANGESGKLFVHGGDGTETATFIDGILVHQPYTSNLPNMAVRGRFNPFMFKGTSFSTSGYSAEYGQALSAILELNTIDEVEQDELNFSAMTVGADIAGSKRIKRGTVSASANYMNLRPYMGLIPQNYTWQKEPRALGGAIKWVQETGLNGQLKFYSSYNQSQLSQDQPQIFTHGTAPLELVNQNWFTHVRWKGIIAPKWQLKVGGSTTHQADVLSQLQWGRRDRLAGTFLKATATFYQKPTTEWKMGIENNRTRYEYGFIRQSAERDSVVSFKESIHAGFVEMSHHFNTKVGMRLGGRLEHSAYLNEVKLSPRATLAYQFSKSGQIAAAYGWFYQNPMAEQLIGRPYLMPEKATQYSMSIQSSKMGRTLRLEGYYKQYSDLVNWSKAENPYHNEGFGFASGLDLYFKDEKTIKGGSYWVSYSYLKGERMYRDYPYSAQPTFIVPHSLSVVYKHWFTKIRSYIGGTFRYGSSRVYNNPNIEGFNTGELPVNRSLDLNYTFLYRENIILYASATNVLNYNQVFGYEFSPEPNAEGHYSATAVLPAANQFFFVGCFVTLSQFGDKNQIDKINF